VVAVERGLPPGDAPHPGTLGDLTVLVLLGGRERTEAEFGARVAGAGFALTRVVPLPEEGRRAVEGTRQGPLDGAAEVVQEAAVRAHAHSLPPPGRPGEAAEPAGAAERNRTPPRGRT
jgi:hypothetical protein